MSLNIKKVCMIFIPVILSACSVVMASRSDGVAPKTLSNCKTRACFIGSGAIPLDSVKAKNGKLSKENFRAVMPRGSAARAVMHGLLDVGTLGIWEVVGTPIEASKGKQVGYVVAVEYNSDGETVKHMVFKF